jgi:glycosyltransferase involved in cell wall biosynthesis
MERILWLTKGLGRGGTERLITTCAPHLDGGRFEVEVAYLMPSKDAYVARLLEQGVKVHCLEAAARDVDIDWTQRLRSLLRAGDFALLHTHSPLPAALARVAAPRHLKMVHTEHNMWSRYRRTTYWANALTYRRNDAVVAVSQAVADSVPRAHLSQGLRRTGIDVVHHGVDLATVATGAIERAAARAALGLPADALVVGTVGNLTEKKDHRMLVEAFALVHRQLPASRLVIIGSGPLEQDLHRWVRDAGLTAVSVLPGSRDDARELMPAFDVFALSSRFEGLSIALVEALAAGVPSVCTRVGGVPEVLDCDLAGLVVPAQDTHAFATSLIRVLSDDRLRSEMGSAARQRAQSFDVRVAVHRLEEIYDRVLMS